MGCKASKDDASDMRVLSHWAKLNLPEPSSDAFDNDFEFQLYKTINLIRLDPQWAIPFVRNVRHHKNYTGANVDLVIEMLKRQFPLPLLKISIEGNAACRGVNEEMASRDQPMCYAITKTYEKMYGSSSSQNNAKNEDLLHQTLGGSSSVYPGKSLSTGIDLQTAGSLKRKHFVNSSNINVSEYQSTNTDVVT